MEIFGDGKLDGGFYPIFKPKKMQVKYRRLTSDLGEPGFHSYGPNSAGWTGFTATPDETIQCLLETIDIMTKEEPHHG